MNRTAVFMSKLSNFEMAVIRNNVDEVDRARLDLINFYRDLNREIEDYQEQIRRFVNIEEVNND